MELVTYYYVCRLYDVRIFKGIGEEGLKQAGESVQIAGTNIAKSLESAGNKIVVGTVILTSGMVMTATLFSINNLQLSHLKTKYGKELKKVDNLNVGTRFDDSIKQDENMILSYWGIYSSVIAFGIVGLYIYQK